MNRIRYSLPVPDRFRLDDLFSGDTLTIPSFQRKYSWDNLDAENLFHDILQVMDKNQRDHFFGQIVTFSDKSGIRGLVDGQQRTVTSLVLIGIIRDLARTLRLLLPKNSAIAKNIYVISELIHIESASNELLYRTKKFNKNSSLTLNLPSYDSSESDRQNFKKYFEGLIIKNGTTTKYTDTDYNPIKLLRMVYHKLRHELTYLLRHGLSLDSSNSTTFTEKVSILSNFFTAFTHNFYVTTLEAPTYTDSIIIYTTLNDRRRTLTPADKVRGLLSALLSDTYKGENTKACVNKAMHIWEKMSRELDGNADEISKFIIEYWNARYGHVNKSYLSRDITQHVHTSNDVWTIINDLVKLAPVYKTLTGKAKDSVFTSSKINDDIIMLNDMGLIQFYPVILALYYKNYSEQDILTMIEDVERIEMRHIVQHIAHTKYSDESHIIWINNWNINKIINDLNSKQLSDETRTKKACSTYQHKYTKRGKGIFTLMFMIAKIYSFKYNDFKEKGQTIYDGIFKNKDYTALRLSHNNVNNNLNNLGNWTIIKKNELPQANNNRNITNLYNALNNSSLNGNKDIAKSIKNAIKKDPKFNDLSHLVSNRQNDFANDYIKVW